MLLEGDGIKLFLQLGQKENNQRWRTNKHFNERAGFLCQRKNFTKIKLYSNREQKTKMKPETSRTLKVGTEVITRQKAESLTVARRHGGLEDYGIRKV